MKIRTLLAAAPVRLLAAGAVVGLVVLGVGGRAAMAAIQAASNTTPPRFTLGGSVTVIALGAASGFAGAVIAVAARWIVERLTPALGWMQYVLLAVALVLVTARGLRGTPVGRWYFYSLVAVYAVLMIWLDRRLTPTRADPQPVPESH